MITWSRFCPQNNYCAERTMIKKVPNCIMHKFIKLPEFGNPLPFPQHRKIQNPNVIKRFASRPRD